MTGDENITMYNRMKTKISFSYRSGHIFMVIMVHSLQCSMIENPFYIKASLPINTKDLFDI